MKIVPIGDYKLTPCTGWIFPMFTVNTPRGTAYTDGRILFYSDPYFDPSPLPLSQVNRSHIIRIQALKNATKGWPKTTIPITPEFVEIASGGAEYVWFKEFQIATALSYYSQVLTKFPDARWFKSRFPFKDKGRLTNQPLIGFKSGKDLKGCMLPNERSFGNKPVLLKECADTDAE